MLRQGTAWTGLWAAYSSGLSAFFLHAGIGVEGEGGYTSVLGLLHHVFLGIVHSGGILSKSLFLLPFLLLPLGLDGVLFGGHGARGPRKAGSGLVDLRARWEVNVRWGDSRGSYY